MKIVLNSDEVNRILIEYLISEGKLEIKETDVGWRVDNYNIKNTYIEIEQ